MPLTLTLALTLLEAGYSDRTHDKCDVIALSTMSVSAQRYERDHGVHLVVGLLLYCYCTIAVRARSVSITISKQPALLPMADRCWKR